MNNELERMRKQAVKNLTSFLFLLIENLNKQEFKPRNEFSLYVSTFFILSSIDPIFAVFLLQEVSACLLVLYLLLLRETFTFKKPKRQAYTGDYFRNCFNFHIVEDKSKYLKVFQHTLINRVFKACTKYHKNKKFSELETQKCELTFARFNLCI
jgi:hypothetical protein